VQGSVESFQPRPGISPLAATGRGIFIPPSPTGLLEAEKREVDVLPRKKKVVHRVKAEAKAQPEVKHEVKAEPEKKVEEKTKGDDMPVFMILIALILIVVLLMLIVPVI
jgi:hypothetical protein